MSKKKILYFPLQFFVGGEKVGFEIFNIFEFWIYHCRSTHAHLTLDDFYTRV